MKLHLPPGCVVSPPASAAAAAAAARPPSTSPAQRCALLATRSSTTTMAAIPRLDLLVDKNAKLSAQCDAQRKQINALEKRQVTGVVCCRAPSLPVSAGTSPSGVTPLPAGRCGHCTLVASSAAPACLPPPACHLPALSCCVLLRRLEEVQAQEAARQETLLCVNRLWEELNASIGFIQFRWVLGVMPQQTTARQGAAWGLWGGCRAWRAWTRGADSARTCLRVSVRVVEAMRAPVVAHAGVAALPRACSPPLVSARGPQPRARLHPTPPPSLLQGQRSHGGGAAGEHRGHGRRPAAQGQPLPGQAACHAHGGGQGSGGDGRCAAAAVP